MINEHLYKGSDGYKKIIYKSESELTEIQKQIFNKHFDNYFDLIECIKNNHIIITINNSKEYAKASDAFISNNNDLLLNNELFTNILNIIKYDCYLCCMEIPKKDFCSFNFYFATLPKDFYKIEFCFAELPENFYKQIASFTNTFKKKNCSLYKKIERIQKNESEYQKLIEFTKNIVDNCEIINDIEIDLENTPEKFQTPRTLPLAINEIELNLFNYNNDYIIQPKICSKLDFKRFMLAMSQKIFNQSFKAENNKNSGIFVNSQYGYICIKLSELDKLMYGYTTKKGTKKTTKGNYNKIVNFLNEIDGKKMTIKIGDKKQIIKLVSIQRITENLKDNSKTYEIILDKIFIDYTKGFGTLDQNYINIMNKNILRTTNAHYNILFEILRHDKTKVLTYSLVDILTKTELINDYHNHKKRILTTLDNTLRDLQKCNIFFKKYEYQKDKENNIQRVKFYFNEQNKIINKQKKKND